MFGRPTFTACLFSIKCSLYFHLEIPIYKILQLHQLSSLIGQVALIAPHPNMKLDIELVSNFGLL